MNILAMDTAASILSLALVIEDAKGRHRWYFEVDAGLRHSELFLTTLHVLLKSAGVSIEDIDLLACMKGPGSFTGLRIALAEAKGFCLAAHHKLALVPTLECVAYAYRDRKGLVVPVLDARSGAFFVAIFRGGRRISEDLDAKPAELAALLAELREHTENVLLVGPDAGLLSEQLVGVPLDVTCEPRRGFARELADLAPDFVDDNALFTGPMYIRKSDAELASH